MKIGRLCEALQVSRSSYYEWRSNRDRPRTARTRSNAELTKRVIGIHEKSRGCYGRPRILRVLRSQGVRVGANRLRRIMVQNGLYGRRRRRYRRLGSDSTHPPAPNLLQRNFRASAPNLIWCGDITQFRIGLEWLYVATVIDLFSRRVVGIAFGMDATTDLVVRAMLDACKRRRPPPGLVFHSDQGSQYGSERFRRLLERRGIVQSMSRSGNCLDNAVAESFFATLEHELASRRVWASPTHAEKEIRNFTMSFYNHERLHSTLDYTPPAVFEQRQAA